MSGFSGAAGRIQEMAARIKAEAESAKAQAEAAAKSILKKTESGDTSTGPVGEGDYIVGAGDCISSIAKDKGYFWKTLWDANPALAAARKNPNVLLPGDKVMLPPKKPKQESGATEMRHRFVRKGEPAKLRLCVKVEDQAIANTPFKFLLDGKELLGMTDAEGNLELSITGNARGGTLTLETPDQHFSYQVQLGQVDPISEISGIQARLANLGFACGGVDGVLRPITRLALQQFQAINGLPTTGAADSQTQALLQTKHGC